MKKLEINLKNHSYDIFIKNNLLLECANYIKEVYVKGKIAIITDSNLDNLYGEKLEAQLKSESYEVKRIVVPAGEQSKHFNILPSLYQQLLSFNLTRSDLIIAFGGGVVGDLAGFVASTYLRGISFIQIPTSLLAQVDSSIGGKVAVDLEEGKNLVGSFYHPKLVLIDPALLETLPSLFFNDGLGEVIKYGCIKDKELFKQLEAYNNVDDLKEDMEEIIYMCCNIKREVVEKDEKDFGERMLLNFGHTLGHAIEKVLCYKHVSHGEAVAIGMYQITQISEKLNISQEGTANRIHNMLTKYKLPYTYDLPKSDLIEAMSVDKKNLDNNLNVILLKDIGESFIYPTQKSFFNELI